MNTIWPYPYRRFRKTGTRIDIGSGAKTRLGFIGIDIRDMGQDLVWDARQGLPFPDNSIVHAYTSHFVEHLTEPEVRELLVEMLRVTAPGGIVEIRCPHCSTIEAYYHGHMSLWSEKRVKGFCAGFERGAVKGEKYFKVLVLQVVGIELQTNLKVERK